MATSIATFNRHVTLFREYVPLLRATCMRHKGGNRLKRPQEGKEKENWIAKAKKESLRRKPHNFTNWCTRKPEDDVWLRMHYPRPQYSLLEAIGMHREMASPEMLDNKDALLSLSMKLDMSTKKKTKFLKYASATVRVPHFFEDGQVHRILAFCQTEEEEVAAREANVSFVGGLDLVKEVQRGDITPDDFDIAVCSVEMLPEIVAIRGVLKDKFPAKNMGALQANVMDAVDFYRFGKKYGSKRLTDAEHELQFTFGRLNQSDEELESNCATFLQSIVKHRPQAAAGTFISGCLCVAPPSTERLGLHLRELVPAAVAPVFSAPEPSQPEQQLDSDSDTEDSLSQRL